MLSVSPSTLNPKGCLAGNEDQQAGLSERDSLLELLGGGQ